MQVVAGLNLTLPKFTFPSANPLQLTCWVTAGCKSSSPTVQQAPKHFNPAAHYSIKNSSANHFLVVFYPHNEATVHYITQSFNSI